MVNIVFVKLLYHLYKVIICSSNSYFGIIYKLYRFNDKSIFELLKLKISVFVLEQNCPYQELDDLDLISDHFFGSLDGQLIGRVYKDLNTVYIGRIAVKRKYRKNGFARKLMEFILEEVKTKFPGLTIELSAQQYLINFYISLGFKTQGETFLEDGIPHVKMTYFN